MENGNCTDCGTFGPVTFLGLDKDDGNKVVQVCEKCQANYQEIPKQRMRFLGIGRR